MNCCLLVIKAKTREEQTKFTIYIKSTCAPSILGECFLEGQSGIQNGISFPWSVCIWKKVDLRKGMLDPIVQSILFKYLKQGKDYIASVCLPKPEADWVIQQVAAVQTN